MRVWLYYRLSRDEDKELNSLTNQKQILVDYCNSHGYTVVGESFDDNVSGMHFDRDGIEKIYEEVDKKSIDAVVVKDLSRLGRHKTQTAIFIDYLRQNDIRVQSYTNKINHVRKELPPEEHYRHENFVPAIISREIWEQAQFLLSEKVRNNVRASSGKPCHRYTGLLKCADCGSSFSCKTRRWKNKPDRYEYVCNGYHRYGSENCTSHRIDEADLDNLIYEELMNLKEDAQKNYDSIESDVKRWLSQKNSAEKRIRELTAKLEQRKSDQQLILLERIRDREHTSVYDEMLVKCDTDIKALTEQIDAIKNFEETIRKRKAEIKSGIDMLDEIIAEGAISNTHLRMLIKEILIAEVDGKLRIKIQMKAKFSSHIDFIPDADDPMYQSMGPCLLER